MRSSALATLHLLDELADPLFLLAILAAAVHGSVLLPVVIEHPE
jgi:hypothetical protein